MAKEDWDKYGCQKQRDYTLFFFYKNIFKRKLKLAKFEAEI